MNKKLITILTGAALTLGLTSVPLAAQAIDEEIPATDVVEVVEETPSEIVPETEPVIEEIVEEAVEPATSTVEEIAPFVEKTKTPPKFDGVEKYAPSYGSNCDTAWWSHPKYRKPNGGKEANIYAIRYGATQAEAQAKDFVTYVPGSVVTIDFDDRSVSNSFYFELKVGYDGKNLTHQIGQTRGKSEACPKPEQPADIVATELDGRVPVCQKPENGKAKITTWSRTTTTTHVFDEQLWEWVLAEPVVGEWVIQSEELVDDPGCTSKIPVINTPEPRTDVEAAPALVNTGGSSLVWAGILGAGSLVLGAIAFVVSRLRRA